MAECDLDGVPTTSGCLLRNEVEKLEPFLCWVCLKLHKQRIPVCTSY